MKFNNVTAEKNDVTKVVKSTLPNAEQIQVFQSDDTSIIYTISGAIKHASISNPVRKIKQSEIRYVIQKIMKSKVTETEVFMTNNGIVHIHADGV